MNIITPETIKVSKTNSSSSSNSNHFTMVTEKIDFSDPRPLLRFKTLLAHQIIKQ
ncbi:unnamed protein product [Paramecium octaurelia]|uniref:Uncharacterized protein n=1 Tax=Paramecium octaurelia TaxID=43137 RepID=A0A8S1URV0_PAROT|nr:unnamed protein product [Paramecium octaurelia]CAD8167174.1 unnamed protein product [Paramecium octaurelia]